jgi:predicted aspartyl protease
LPGSKFRHIVLLFNNSQGFSGLQEALIRIALPVCMLGFLALTAGAGEGQTLTDDQLAAVRRGADALRLPPEGTGVPLLGPQDLPLVEVYVNGRGPYRFLVDLGSNVVLLRRDVVDSAGVEVILERSGTDIVRMDRMEIGGASYEDVHAGSYDELDVSGVIGYNLLSQSSFTLDFPARRLAIHRDSLPRADGDRVLEYLVQDRLPYLSVTLDDSTLLLNFDTGATNWIVMPPSMADSLRWMTTPRPGPVLFNNQTGAIRATIARLDGALEFGRYRIERPVVFLDPAVEDAWLGAALLAHYALDFDPARSRVRIEGPREAVAPPYCTSGFRLTADAEGARVTDVIPETPAALQLAIGDRIREVEGIPAARLEARALHALACERDTLSVRRERGGRVERLEIPTADIE